MKRFYIQIFGLIILLSQLALTAYTAFTVTEFPHRYQQELDNTTKQLTIEDTENYRAGKQEQLSTEDAILEKAKDISIKSVITAYDAKISKLLSWQTGLFLILILTSIVPFVIPLED